SRLADPARDVWVHVEGISRSDLDGEPLWLLRANARQQPERASDDDAPLLRAHLESTARTLQRAMEEVASQNLALATANDELQSINEELERSNHRLAAVNTELIAVRQDHERQIEELSGLNHDVDNLLRSAEIALVVLDAAHRIRRYTPAAASLFCLTRRDVGHGFGKFLREHKRRVMDAVERIARDGGNARLRLDWATPEGEPRAFQVQIHPYVTDRDHVSGSVVGFVDLSDIKAAQDNLERQNQALQRANEDLERFAYIASHDLKSPLRSVRTMLEFLRTDLGDVLQPDNAEHLDLVAQRVQQMERMIEDLLAYSRLGREAGAIETVDVRALVRSQIELLDTPEGVHFDIQSEVTELRTEPGLLQHVIRNLVENAIKHHDRNDPNITIRCFEIERTPVFEVSDDGPGIPERYQQRVFEIFQKGGGRATTGGSGMGLALVKKAVESQGGTITLLSKDDERGTTFRFTWPEKAQAAPPPPAAG
ncbi:MAG: sensor histidine kinase, partial [Planctomycetota bacterium]